MGFALWKRARGSIAAKQIGMAALPIALIVGFLAYYFPSHEIAALAQDQRTRAATYGKLLSEELRSAVAFADRETAREVLTGLEAEADVVVTVLYGSRGEILYQRGTPSPEVEAVREAAGERRVIDFDDRVAVVSPVVSLEGPRGLLAIELSTARLAEQRSALALTAIASGAAALVFGMLAAWWIARSLVRRLHAINRVAQAVAKDAHDEARAPIDSSDELGQLGDAFNHMLAQLRAERQRLHDTVNELRATEDALEASNLELEHKVVDLRAATENVRAEMERRARIEIELRQAQKLESVGRLAAGIAHELNTPLQFANDSCTFLSDATTDLLALIALRQQIVDEHTSGAITMEVALARVRAAEQDANLEYIVETIPEACRSALTGMSRASAIVKAMKEFAYADKVEHSPADLNRAIQSTIVVAKNEYKYVADLETDLADLPPITCHLGELNQVVLNIVVNAAHAIADRKARDGKRGLIRIETRADATHATITISDDGCGIPQHVLDKIFDPFFTTKPIGKGSGQGLAIARSIIVDKHGGTIEVASTAGEGSTFVVRIPIAGMRFQEDRLAS